MTPTLLRILFCLMWAVLGVLASWISFVSLQKQAYSINPNDTLSLKKMPMLMAGLILKMLLIAVVIYLALRMNVVYAIVFVVAMTITTLALVINLNSRAKKLIDDQH